MTIEKCDQQRRRQSIVYRRLWTVKQTKPSEWASNDKTHTGTPIQCAFDGRVEIYSWYVGRARPQQNTNTHYMICTMADDDVEGERAKSRPCNRDNSLIYVTTTNVLLFSNHLIPLSTLLTIRIRRAYAKQRATRLPAKQRASVQTREIREEYDVERVTDRVCDRDMKLRTQRQPPH